jgi:phosphatidylinositol glycan class K
MNAALLCLLLSTLFVAILSSSSSSHQSNHAVIVSSSRYWFNYRHTTNAISIYQLLRSKGVPDENIVFMLADEYAINDRNVFKNRLLTKGRSGPSLFDETTQIDYRGEDVTVDNLIRVLLDRQHDSSLPTLRSNEHSNVLVYLTGHGGDQFFKFQDVEEITSLDLAQTFRHMKELNKYQELLFIVDTCQAFTLGDHMSIAPNVTIIGSSLKGESSYAHHSDPDLGLSVTERYTAAMVEYVSKHGGKQTLKKGLIDPYPFATQRAHIGYSDATAVRKVTEVIVNDFFANVAPTVASRKLQETDLDMVDTSELLRFWPPSFPEDVDHAGKRRQREKLAENECPIEDSDKQRSTTTASQSITDTAFPGMDPTNPTFLTLIAICFGTVAWVSRRH